MHSLSCFYLHACPSHSQFWPILLFASCFTFAYPSPPPPLLWLDNKNSRHLPCTVSCSTAHTTSQGQFLLLSPLFLCLTSSHSFCPSLRFLCVCVRCLFSLLLCHLVIISLSLVFCVRSILPPLPSLLTGIEPSFETRWLASRQKHRSIVFLVIISSAHVNRESRQL